MNQQDRNKFRAEIINADQTITTHFDHPEQDLDVQLKIIALLDLVDELEKV